MSRTQLSDHLIGLAIDLRRLEPARQSPITKIDKWAVARRVVPCLIGRPTHHPKIVDGEPMFTSELYFLDAERSLARSFSRWYELGEQVELSFWEQKYPRLG